MILKLLLIIGVIYIVYTYFIKQKPLAHNNYKKSNKKETKFESNDLVECAKCGTYVEIDEAIISNGKYYCSYECTK